MGKLRLPEGVSLSRIGLAAAVAYLGAHALTGQTGVGSTMELTEQETRLTQELAELQAERASLQNEVRRLRSETLDLDLLEERARTAINAAHPDEILLAPPAG